MQIRSANALESNINVTPFVDICLVLLIVFMIVVPAMMTGVAVQLPIAKGGAVPEAMKQSVVTVKDDGTVYVDSLVIRHDEFALEIRKLHARYPQKPIAVRGDRRVDYGQVVDVLEACREAGYTDVRLRSQRR